MCAERNSSDCFVLLLSVNFKRTRIFMNDIEMLVFKMCFSTFYTTNTVHYFFKIVLGLQQIQIFFVSRLDYISSPSSQPIYDPSYLVFFSSRGYFCFFLNNDIVIGHVFLAFNTTCTSEKILSVVKPDLGKKMLRKYFCLPANSFSRCVHEVKKGYDYLCCTSVQLYVSPFSVCVHGELICRWKNFLHNLY